ncbi:hypothetical protein GS397_27480 (plasmid) [Sphingobium yanoikuyae]|uniref:Lipoprotein n=1 Tax=Sphingobium yanoikuyae TaxID=13690 RepID=A0A6P1GQH8_SPHYA|nr:hypothetical protein [Sphingobium yanoikuyae]QHD70845.1 hypothetical protein GS397_27480 [Sphingobium yanoikuyae]SCW93534.1 hypothetical protein SAMN02927924_04346 [Sphingobium faniae]
MVKVKHGALSARRWGRILCVGLASCVLAACATTSDGRNPPDHCSRGKARPANANGSVLLQAAVGAVPAPGLGRSAEVMVFGKDGEQAAPNAPAETVVPAPPTATEGAPAAPAGRPLSMRRDLAPLQSEYGSC